MAKQIEDVANEMEQQHLEFVTFSVTPSAKAILVFREADTKVPACVNKN